MSTHSLPISAKNVGSLLAQLITPHKLAALTRQHRTSAAGAPATLSAFWLIAGMVFHVLQPVGLLSTHLYQLTRKRMADSTLSERRQVMGVALFHALLDHVLTTLADIRTQPRAFYKGHRLVGMDGSVWSVANTPEIKASAKKTHSRRKKAAFFKLSMTALYELGTHNPLAARIGMEGESEMALATSLISRLQAGWLLLTDRYYGVARFIVEIPAGVLFLIRVRKNLKSRKLQQYRDGSCLVEIRDKTSGKKILLREIHARVRRRSGGWVTVRFWTNLLDPVAHPAKELVRLYGIRWEHECAYRELKVHLRRSPLLMSHTLVTAAQEVACLVLAQAIIARIRLTVAQDQTPVLQISFVHTLHMLRSFWTFTALIDDLVPDTVWPAILRRLLAWMAQLTSPPRRNRSCPRKLRQPVSKWPRLLRNSSTNRAFQFNILRKSS